MPVISTPKQGSGNHSATGGPGRSPGTPNAQMRIRMEKVARMRVNGIRDCRIQELLQMQPAAFKYMVNLDEYKNLEEDILAGHLTEMDEATAGQVNVLKQQLRTAVPAALRALVDGVTQRRDLRTALAAASEILDRDPDATFVKRKASDGDSMSDTIPTAIMDAATSAGDKAAEDLNKKKETIQ